MMEKLSGSVSNFGQSICRRRGISYRRVSTDEQADKGFSLPTQLSEIELYATKNGVELVADFVDDFSGSVLERPGLTAARACLKAGRADLIIALDSDRLTREPIHYMLLREEFSQYGVELHYAKRGRVDLNDFGQMLVEDFYGRFAHEWKRKIIEATTRGRRGKAKQGHVIVHGRPPYGYRRVETDGVSMLIPDEHESRVVQEVYRLYVVKDIGYPSIVRHLSKAKTPTRADTHKGLPCNKKRGQGEWSVATIQRILSREVYMGKWYYSKISGDPIEIDVPAIVPIDLWEAAQQKRKSNRGGRLNKKYDWLLSGRCICGNCGSPATTQATPWRSKNARGVTRYYRCWATRKEKVGVVCDAPTFRCEQVEDAVWGWIRGLLLDDGSLEAGLAEYQQFKAQDAQPIKEEIERYEALIEKKRKRQERLLNLFLDGDMPKEEYTSIRKQLHGDIVDASSKLRVLEQRLDSVTLTPNRIADIKAFAREIRSQLNLVDTDFVTKRQIINALDVRTELILREGQKYVRISCVLNTSVPLDLCANYTSSGKRKLTG